MKNSIRWPYLFYASLLIGAIVSRWLINYSAAITMIFFVFVVSFYFILFFSTSNISIKKKNTFVFFILLHSIFLSMIMILSIGEYYPHFLEEKNKTFSIILGVSYAFWSLFLILIPVYISFTKVKRDNSQTEEEIVDVKHGFWKRFHFDESSKLKALWIVGAFLAFVLPYYPMNALVAAEEKEVLWFLLSLVLVPSFLLLFLKPVEMILFNLNTVNVPQKTLWLYFVASLLMIFSAFVF